MQFHQDHVHVDKGSGDNPCGVNRKGKLEHPIVSRRNIAMQLVLCRYNIMRRQNKMESMATRDSEVNSNENVSIHAICAAQTPIE
jgi:hypothetical protein